jgi:hypothetical protein
MFNYTARARPLWRILLAQSLTIAVALLIELGMMGQGSAACSCMDGPFLLNKDPRKQVCPTARKEPVNANFPGGTFTGTLEGVVVMDSRKNPNLDPPLSNPRYPSASSRADKVWALPSNQRLKDYIKNVHKDKPDGRCLCIGDQVCFPIFTPIVSHVVAVRHRHLLRHARRHVLHHDYKGWYVLRKVYVKPPRH